MVSPSTYLFGATRRQTFIIFGDQLPFGKWLGGPNRLSVSTQKILPLSGVCSIWTPITCRWSLWEAVSLETSPVFILCISSVANVICKAKSFCNTHIQLPTVCPFNCMHFYCTLHTVSDEFNCVRHTMALHSWHTVNTAHSNFLFTVCIKLTGKH